MTDADRVAYWVSLAVPWAAARSYQPAVIALEKVSNSMNVQPRLLRTWAQHWLSGSEQRTRLSAKPPATVRFTLLIRDAARSTPAEAREPAPVPTMRASHRNAA